MSPAKEKRLIIHSDIIQNSKFLSFNRDGGKKSPEKLISYIEKDYLMPSLSGFDVHVAGVGGNVSDRRTRHVEQFWEKYFEVAGSELQFYGPLLL